MIAGVHILGIRHHGPGSARSVCAALAAIQPDVILLEGPPDAQELLPLAGAAGMKPPVALLLYRPDAPTRGVYYPFAEFSPEWQAMRYGLGAGVPVQFMDLPQRHRLADESECEAELPRLHSDPLALVAEAAGYQDGERWWEEQFERRYAGLDAFKAVLELMTALREDEAQHLALGEARREAWMRQTLRDAQKQGFQRIAIVCGAYHGPALAKLPTAKSDADLLKGLPRVAITATWVPWTHRHLTFASGYGAGVHSPGYYEHLWSTSAREEVALRWMVRVAHFLRAEDLETSTASIIEATRLADTIASLRGQAVPGLVEFQEAARAVFCYGSDAAMRLVGERLEVGHALGAVSEDAPRTPLQQDLQREQKRLRLPPEALDRTLELDLRKPHDLDRSLLLHRLRLLSVPWGKTETVRGKGTFREVWKLRWEPEFEVGLIEGAPWGNTVAAAATALASNQAMLARSLPQLTTLVGAVLQASLPTAVPPVMQALANHAALTGDVGHLMEAVPPLAEVLRYGNVRQTDGEMLRPVVEGLVARICAGLPPACSALGEEAAAEMFARLNATHGALAALADDDLRGPWQATLARLEASETVPGLLSGRCTRLLFDDNVRTFEETEGQLSRSLSRAAEPAQAAAWVEGFVSGGGLLLIHRPELWALLDQWLVTLPPEHFTAALPLLRRAFAEFSVPERRQMGELAARGSETARSVKPLEEAIEPERAACVLPTLAAIFGITLPEPPTPSSLP